MSRRAADASATLAAWRRDNSQIVSAKWLLILPCVDLRDTGRRRAGNDRPVDGMCTPAGVAALLG